MRGNILPGQSFHVEDIDRYAGAHRAPLLRKSSKSVNVYAKLKFI
jgi:hypothetical protein